MHQRPLFYEIFHPLSTRLPQEALDSLDAIDRDVLALRHFEHLSRTEAVLVLGTSQDATSKRYFGAVKRFKDLLATMPGGWQGP